MKAVLYILLALMASFPAMGTVLTSVSKANAIPLENITQPIDFELTGTVLRVDREFITFADETDGTILFHTTAEHGLQLWDRVLTKGKMVIADTDKTRRFLSREINVLEHGAKPPVAEASARDLIMGKFNFKLVKMRGVVSTCIPDEVSPDYYWMSLKTETGNCYVTVYKPAMPQISLSGIINSQVEFYGLIIPIAGLRKSLGRHLLVYEADGIKIIKNAPNDPFSGNPLSEDPAILHRQHISGDVIAVEKRKFFLRTNIGRIIVVYPSADAKLPSAGETVAVAGFPEHAPYWLCLNEALVKKTGKSSRPLELPIKTSIKSLFENPEGSRRFRTNITGHRLTVHGKIIASTNGEIEISDGKNSVFVELASLSDSPQSVVPEIGATIEATGLCWSEFQTKTDSDIYPSFLRFKLYPYNANDIRILELSPWWTPFKLATLIGILFTVLIGLGIWNFMLNRKAERRGRKLYEERIGHALAKHKVEERTHLAVELHDSISQTLTGVALHLDSGETETAKTLLASCREELRHCIWDLRSRTFEEKDMTEAIERTIAPHLGGIKANVRFNVSKSRISESATHAVLRIIRELVSNAIRHGGAKQIWIAGECDEGRMSFSVKDDGCGFDPENIPGPEQGHFGLLGIRERIEYFNGELKIESSPGAGTKVRVSINMEEYENGN